MDLMVVAGEASGDAHAADLVRALQRRCPDLRVFGCGGDQLAAAGCELLVSAHDLGVVGLAEVVEHLPRIWGLWRRLRRALLRRRPEALILVDFPDFNLPLAKTAHQAGIPAIYFVSPQLWAWRRGRVRRIQRSVARMICIFPFEEEFYRTHGVEVSYVGHPLVERVARARETMPSSAAFRAQHSIPATAELIALLPGSRRRELDFHLPTVLAAAARLAADGDRAFVLPVAPGLDPDRIQQACPPVLQPHLHLVSSADAYPAVAHSRLALVASGTATVETALLGTPMVVFYRLSPWTYRLGRRLVHTPHYAMVNLIAGHTVVPELIQNGFTVPALVAQAQRLLPEGPARAAMIAGLAEVRTKLGPPGAIERAADVVASTLNLYGETAARPSTV
ncbi:MAG: lipid-A-disaccharide synthase [Terriglobales bacterium]